MISASLANSLGWTGGTYYVTALSVGAIVCIAARGERALYEVTPNAQQSFKIESCQVVYLLYVKNIPPTPENPWGLLVHGFRTLEGQEADRVWNEAIPLQIEEHPAKKEAS